MILTADAFPSPDRINTFADGIPLTSEQQAELARRQAFAQWQANIVNAELVRLQKLETPPAAEDWAEAYCNIVEWRYALGIGWQDQQVVATQHNLLTPITDDNPNRDRLGDLGRFRIGAKWDAETQALVGGSLTPAGKALIAAGERIHARMDAAGADDELQNRLRLPDGTVVNGNRLIRGETARCYLLEQRDRLAARGSDVSRFETGADVVMVQTATEADRTTIFQAVMAELGRLSLQAGTPSRQQLLHLSYLLFQAPQMKRGSDSVIRTHNGLSSTYLTGVPLRLPPDADLLALTVEQDDYILTAQA